MSGGSTQILHEQPGAQMCVPKAGIALKTDAEVQSSNTRDDSASKMHVHVQLVVRANVPARDGEGHIQRIPLDANGVAIPSVSTFLTVQPSKDTLTPRAIEVQALKSCSKQWENAHGIWYKAQTELKNVESITDVAMELIKSGIDVDKAINEALEKAENVTSV